MSLRAMAAPTEIDTPAVPPSAAETEAAPANALMIETSDARADTLAAEIPVVPSPLMNADVFMSMRFSTYTPEPAKPTPAVPPTAIATEPANTTVPIF